MDTPKLVMKKSTRLSIGKHRLNKSTISAANTLDYTSVLHTPPRTNDTPNGDSKCSTPVTKKKAFIAEESPSQDYECFSPVIPASQDARSEYQDVGWVWDENPSKSAQHSGQHKDKSDNKSKRKMIPPKSRYKAGMKSSGPDQKSESGRNRGFYIFQKEIENIKQNNWHLNDQEFDDILIENIGTTKGEEVSKKSTVQNISKSKDSPRQRPVMIESRTVSSLSRNNSEKTTESSFTFNGFDDSDMDAMLLEASQTVDKNPIKSLSAKETTEVFPPENETAVPIEDKKNSLYSNLNQKAKSSYSRHNSLPCESRSKQDEKLSARNQDKSFKNDLKTSCTSKYNARVKTICSEPTVERDFNILKKGIENSEKHITWDLSEDELDASLKENFETVKYGAIESAETSKTTKIQNKRTMNDLHKPKSVMLETKVPSTKNNSKKSEENMKESSFTFNCFDDSDMDEMLLLASQTVENNFTKETPQITAEKTETQPVIEDSNFEAGSIDDILLSIPDDELCNANVDKYSEYLNARSERKSLFSRHNSMPYETERNDNIGQAKTLNRHNSMPPGQARNSATVQSSTTKSSIEDFNSGIKRLCTKEEMEQKRLEAKKRQMISQQKRMMLNQKNIVNAQGRNSNSSSSSSLKSVKR